MKLICFKWSSLFFSFSWKCFYISVSPIEGVHASHALMSSFHTHNLSLSNTHLHTRTRTHTSISIRKHRQKNISTLCVIEDGQIISRTIWPSSIFFRIFFPHGEKLLSCTSTPFQKRIKGGSNNNNDNNNNSVQNKTEFFCIFISEAFYEGFFSLFFHCCLSMWQSKPLNAGINPINEILH